MQRNGFRFFERLRVRWAEVDLQNIVFNGHYLTYWDIAISGYWRALGLPYTQAMAQLGAELFVRKATLEYWASAAYEDSLDVGMRCARLGRSSITFECCVFRDDQALVSGELVYVYADAHARKSMPVPEALRQMLQDYEQGKDLWALTWSTLPEHAEGSPSVRELVMTNRLVMSIGRLQCREHPDPSSPLPAGVAGRSHELIQLDITPGVRGQGMGGILLNELKRESRAQGCSTLWARVPRYRITWFTQAGFTCHEEADDPAASDPALVTLAL